MHLFNHEYALQCVQVLFDNLEVPDCRLTELRELRILLETQRQA